MLQARLLPCCPGARGSGCTTTPRASPLPRSARSSLAPHTNHTQQPSSTHSTSSSNSSSSSRPWCRRAHRLAASAQQQPAAADEEQQQADDDEQQQQPQQELRTVTLRKPMGLVLAQNAGGPVFVEEVTPGGNAERGQVQAGDVLSKCSAVVLKAGTEGQFEREGYGQRPYDNFERVTFSCENQDFKSVKAALNSNNSRWGIMDVTLVLRRPADAAEAALCTKKSSSPPAA